MKKNIFSSGLKLYCAVLVFVLTSHAVPAAPPAKFILLKQFARTHGFVNVKEQGKTITISNRFHVFVLQGDSRRATYNGVTVWLNQPVTKLRDGWAITRVDADKSLLPLIFPHRGLTAVGRQIVVLDAGHGGKDVGATSPRQVQEKRTTLYLAQAIGDILRRKGVQVKLTRERDVYLPLSTRCVLAEKWDADLFVSIHLNSAASKTANGIETHILPPAGSPITASSKPEARDNLAYAGNRFDQANTHLGYSLQKQILQKTGAADRGVRRSRFYVIRNVSCPAALVECGFISNPAEENKIIQKAYRDKLAQGIADGILNYLESAKQAHRLTQ